MKYSKLCWSFCNRGRDQNCEVLMWRLECSSRLELRIIWPVVKDGTENVAGWNTGRIVARVYPNRNSDLCRTCQRVRSVDLYCNMRSRSHGGAVFGEPDCNALGDGRANEERGNKGCKSEFHPVSGKRILRALVVVPPSGLILEISAERVTGIEGSIILPLSEEQKIERIIKNKKQSADHYGENGVQMRWREIWRPPAGNCSERWRSSERGSIRRTRKAS